MERMCEIYTQRRNGDVKGPERSGWPCHKPAGAFYAFPSIKHTGLTSIEFCRRLRRKNRRDRPPGTAFVPRRRPRAHGVRPSVSTRSTRRSRHRRFPEAAVGLGPRPFETVFFPLKTFLWG
jgi:aspartate/methionine/tyrosine aminotransferase